MKFNWKFWIVVWILCLAGGMLVGYLFRPTPEIKPVKQTFCQMDENQRFKVCPIMRLYRSFPTGGVAIIYKCSNNLGYYETQNLSAESQVQVNKELLNGIVGGIVHKKVCNTKHGSVYMLVKVLNG